jgi:hypothetical protein
VAADSDLDRPGRIDDALAHGARHEGAVRQLLAVVRPGVLVRIELDESERPILGRVSLQERPGDEVVAAQREEVHIGIEHAPHLRRNGIRDRVGAMKIERDVAVVHNGEFPEDVDPERILRIAVEDGRGAADRLRPEAGARAVGDGHVERDAEHGEIHAGEVAAVTAAHERQRAGIGRVGGAPLQRLRAEGVVYWRLAEGVGHSGSMNRRAQAWQIKKAGCLPAWKAPQVACP